MIKSISSGLFLCFLTVLLLSPNRLNAGVTFEKELRLEEQDAGVMLRWSTSFEIENKLFIIEKAEDGEEFTSIGAIGGAGDKDALTAYNFYDSNNYGKYVLYRLQQVDRDGTISYTKAIVLDRGQETSFTVSRMREVIASDQFEVTFDMMVNANLEYQLKKMNGEIILQENMIAQKGVNDLSINMEGATLGLYKMILTVEGKSEEIIFEKVKSEQELNQSITAEKN